MDIIDIREKIDRIDRDIAELLQKRAQLAKQAGVLKKEAGRPIYDPDREKEVLRQVTETKGPLTTDALNKIFAVIIEETRGMEGE